MRCVPGWRRCAAASSNGRWRSWAPSSCGSNAELGRRGLGSPFPDADRGGEPPMGTRDGAVTTVDVTAWLERKLAAVQSHRSQLGAAAH